MARISVNKLGEYLAGASPARRRRIIVDQKKPITAISARYRAADEPVRAFFIGGGADESIIDQAVVALRTTPGKSDWATGDRQATADALDQVLKLAPKVLAANRSFRAPTAKSTPLTVAGVDISVAPHLIITSDAKGGPLVGAVKFHYVQDSASALTKAGSEYVATILHQWLLANPVKGHVASPALCMSIDVFRGAVVAAPVSFVKRLADVEAACEEIAARWPLL